MTINTTASRLLSKRKLFPLLLLCLGSSAVSAYGIHSEQAAMESCLYEAKARLDLKSDKPFGRDYGVVKHKHRQYEIYFNVTVNDSAEGLGQELKVKCVSPGFARISAFTLDAGSWAFVARGDLARESDATRLAGRN